MQATMNGNRTTRFAMGVVLAVLTAFATAPGLAGARDFTSSLWRELRSSASHVRLPEDRAQQP